LPEECSGKIIEMVAMRKGEMLSMEGSATGNFQGNRRKTLRTNRTINN
jgi:predicted membrane GTPase involved in stress response